MSNRGRILPALSAAQRRLLATANTDGGWGHVLGRPSDPISTAYSLIALAGDHHHTSVVRDGTRYLLSQQNADGGYTSVPDQAGPRPLPYSIPVLANHSVLLAMTHLNPNLNLSDTASALLNTRE